MDSGADSGGGRPGIYSAVYKKIGGLCGHLQGGRSGDFRRICHGRDAAGTGGGGLQGQPVFLLF